MKNGIYVLIFMQTENNSVKNNCSVDSKITKIRLLFNSPKLKEKILVIVEGITDKIYKYLFDCTKVELDYNNSCDGLIKFIDVLNKDYKDCFIVIKDADFDHLNHVTYNQYDNLFLTDTHDIETMMLSVKDIEKKLAAEFLPNDEEGFVLRCLNHLEPLSYLKWYNIAHHLNLIVKAIKVGNVYDGSNKISLKKCETELYKVKINEDRCPCVSEKVREFIKYNETEDKWNLVNGHDLCAALNIFFKDRGYSGGDVAMCLRMAYTTNDFQQTKLYCAIKDWETIHKKSILK